MWLSCYRRETPSWRRVPAHRPRSALGTAYFTCGGECMCLATSDPDETADLEKKAVVCTSQVTELQPFGFRQVAAGEHQRARRRLVRDERVDAEAIVRERQCWRMESGLAGA